MTSVENAFGYTAGLAALAAASACAYATPSAEPVVQAIFGASSLVLGYMGIKTIQKVWTASHPAIEKT